MRLRSYFLLSFCSSSISRCSYLTGLFAKICLKLSVVRYRSLYNFGQSLIEESSFESKNLKYLFEDIFQNYIMMVRGSESIFGKRILGSCSRLEVTF